MAETREGRVRRAVTSALEKAGWLVVRTDASRIFALPKGFPDLLAIRPEGDIAFIECKSPRTARGGKVWPAGRLSKAQSACIERLRQRGYHVRVVRSVAEIHDLIRWEKS